MACNFYVVTPCGGSIEETNETIATTIAIARLHPTIEFFHYLVFNNGLGPTPTIDDPPSNYHAEVADLGQQGSRARARNTGLDSIATLGEPGLVCFIDAGDVLLNEGALDIVFDKVDRDPKGALWAFAARIVGNDVRSTRGPRPLFLRKVNNPFLIGATFVTADVATQVRFVEGAKEDWKYWLDVLGLSPKVELLPEVAYEYRVVSTTNHIGRKAKLVGDQYRFFAQYLGYGNGPRTWASLVAHMLIAGTAWLRRSTRLRPFDRTTQ